MPLPTPDAYNDAIQTPRLAFPDPVLAAGKVECNGFGIPKALGGGFAITYRVNSNGRAFAVRCFHKEVQDIQDRYRLIHNGLRTSRLGPFVDFEYQQKGICVKGKAFPIVRMEWVAGTTLGEYVEANYANGQAMVRLRAQFASLEQDLARSGLAHGDLQNGNVLVDQNQLRLVDYDGMFVSGMPVGKGTELGHKHFQHPLRNASDFGPEMDRFSFIVIDLSLWALSLRPDLFKQFSTGENILFSANDFADPDSSTVFQTLILVGDLSFQLAVADFACVCKADFKSIPRLSDFLTRTAIPMQAARLSPWAPAVGVYIAALPVVDAGSFEAVCEHIGDRVELVGQVVEVKTDSTRRGAPYVFINFRHWRDNCVKATIWSEGLHALGYTPDSTWKGLWLAINGMIDPVYHGKNRFKTIQYVSVGPTVTDRSQIHKLTKEEALWRLGKGSRTGASASAPRSQGPIPDKNREIIRQLGGGTTPPTRTAPGSATPIAGVPKPASAGLTGQCSVRSRNAQVLQQIAGRAGPASRGGGSTAGSPKKPEPKGCAKAFALVLAGFLTIVTFALLRMF